MVCFHPRTIWVRNSKPIDFQSWSEQNQHNHNRPKMTPQPDYWNWTEMQVPCNCCLGCKLDHSNMWATRCTLEAKQWKNCCFITLTYNNKNLPLTENGIATLVKKHVQDFLKRLRYYEKGAESWENCLNGKIENPIRYFLCGEYGTHSTLRPHYHLCLFNYRPQDLVFYKQNKHGDNLYKSKSLQKIWGKGFVVVGDLTHKSANYTARYTMKKAGLQPKTRLWKWKKDGTREFYKPKFKREQEFILMSRGVGIGRSWWEENKQFCEKWGNITLNIDGKIEHKPLPRYFKKLWEQEDWNTYEYYKFKQAKQAIINHNEIIKKHNMAGLNDEVKMSRILKQQEEILTAKSQALKRSNFI